MSVRRGHPLARNIEDYLPAVNVADVSTVGPIRKDLNAMGSITVVDFVALRQAAGQARITLL
ncbi:MAG TPA: hypothetical protein VGH37_05220 [Candidatus Acidoferrum sp.]